MKTREKILYASLALFNDEGEQNVTTVDIAAAIDISPGNLYYHFKGKPLIILELYEAFEAEFVEILNAPLSELKGDDSWIYIYILFERIYQFRFFYQNQHDILQRVPEVRPRFKRLLNRKFNTFVSLLENFRDAGVIGISDEELGVVAENIVLLQTHWLNYLQGRIGAMEEDVMLHRGVFQLISMITPYLTEDHMDIKVRFREIYLSKVGAG